MVFDPKELTLTVQMKEDISFLDVLYRMSQTINSSMAHHELLKKHHETKHRFKGYVFSYPLPTESDGIYKKDQVYSVILRTETNELADLLKNVLHQFTTENMSILSVMKQPLRLPYASIIETATPAIITVGTGKDTFWVSGRDMNGHKHTIPLLMQRLDDILKGKMKNTLGIHVPDNERLIKSVELKSKMPRKINYKGWTYLGNKLVVHFNESENANQASLLALSSGIGQKNSSMGAGFCQAISI